MLYKLNNIRKKYNNREILNIDKFNIEKGKVYIFTGPNGSGKTTLLNILAFLDTKYQGEVIYEQNKESSLADLRRKVTMVMQDHFIFNGSVYDNLAYGLNLRGLSRDKIRTKAQSILKDLNLEHLTGNNARTLSGGESKRLAIARAIILEPDVIILDEPTANMDKPSTEAIEKMILDINKEKKITVICSTHDFNQAYRLNGQVISLVSGMLVGSQMDNLFCGQLHEDKNLKWMEIAKDIKIWLDTEREGISYIAIDPKNIIVSKSALESSARNSFKGKIIKTSLGEHNVKITVDAGVEFYAFITKDSFGELGLNLGDWVYLTFKSSSVTVL